MAVPTRRKSRANTRSRRSQWRARPDGCGPNTPGGLVSADYRHRVAGEVGDIDLAGDGVDRHPGRSGADGWMGEPVTVLVAGSITDTVLLNWLVT
ncbi:50S ribosomal protein L32 [Mycobacterium tuberculosis]|nr:50S ribosomal protein L32 [Mycobacterium tuberculosis]